MPADWHRDYFILGVVKANGQTAAGGNCTIGALIISIPNLQPIVKNTVINKSATADVRTPNAIY
jgi:hypothetical protein